MYSLIMGKTLIIEEIKKTIAELDIMLPQLKASKNLKINGNLQCTKRGDKINYYQVFDDGSKKYLGCKDQQLIVDLANKRHFCKMIDALEREKDQLERCMKTLGAGNQVSDIDEVYPSLHEGIRRLSAPFSITDDGYAMKWLKKNSYLRNRKQLSGQNKTLKGEYVKSKSEVIIADRLTYYGVPYVYEITTAQDAFDEMRYPDFFILNKRTRKEYFWEHLGRMGDSQYAAKNQVKMEQFARQGILPGNNLIVSFECGERPLSTEYVDTIIKQLLV